MVSWCIKSKSTGANFDVAILGIHKGASKAEIKKAYHKVPIFIRTHR